MGTTLRSITVQPVAVQVLGGDGSYTDVSPSSPLEVKESSPAPAQVLRRTYSGTVGTNSSARIHGGDSGTPTLQGVIGYRWIQITLSVSSSDTTTVRTFRVRRRYLNEQGAPHIDWMPWKEYQFTPSASLVLNYLVQDTYNASTDFWAADEIEMELVNPSTSASLSWSAAIIGLRGV